MSLQLDQRQRAILQEMGVRVWLPCEAPLPIVADILHAPPLVHPAKSEVPAHGVHPAPLAAAVPSFVSKKASLPTPCADDGGKPLPMGIADMDWSALGCALAQCQACAMATGRRAPVLQAPNESLPCDWLVVGDPPDAAQEREGRAFVEDPGKLLDNMLRAVGVRRLALGAELGTDLARMAPAQRAYLSCVLKCRPALMRAPSGTELATCASYLRREIALIQPKVILAMGRFAMQLLLSDMPPECAKLPLGKLRGQVWHYAGVPLVLTYPPAYLLHSGQDKAKAWADLCLAKQVASGAVKPRLSIGV